MDHRGRGICQGRAWWGRKRFSENTWNIIPRQWLSSASYTYYKGHFPSWELLPAFHPPFPPAFSSSKCLSLYPLPPLPSAHLDLNALSHYKPNITSHLLIVTSIYFTESFFSPLYQLPLNSTAISYILANPCPRCPTRYYTAPSVILSIPDCSTFPSCQNVLLSSTSSPKSL